MDPIIERLNAIHWDYADQDTIALENLRNRIQETGRQFRLISYSDLVRNVDFQYANINNGQPFQIAAYEWTGLDRHIVGDCLGYLSRESYLEANFMASSLVIARTESKPSDIFFDWMKELGVLPDLNEDTVLRFWTEQVRNAHQWYKYGKRVASTNAAV